MVEIEYTTKKGNTLVFSYRTECFTGEGPSAQYGQVYLGMNIINPDYESIVEDEEIAKVLAIARDEGDEILEDYIKSQKPKKYKVNISRTYHCVYAVEHEVVAESKEDAYDKATGLIHTEFRAHNIGGVFNRFDLIDDEDTIELI